MQLTEEQVTKLEPNHPIFLVLERLTTIEEKMLQNDPEISTHLKEIWKHMQQYEELAHLLTPAQIGVLMKGLQKHTAIQLIVDTPKSSKKSKKVGVDDLI